MANLLKGPLIPMLSLAGGIVMSKVLEIPWWVGVFPIACAIAIYIFLIKKSSDPVAAYKAGKWHIAWAILLFLGIGVTNESFSRPAAIEEIYGGASPDSLYCEVTGVLTKTYGDRIDAVIEGTNGAKARIRTGVTEVSTGDIIKIPSKYLHHIASDTTSIGRKIMPMMKSAGILYSGWVSPKHIEVVGQTKGIRHFFYNIREYIESRIERSHLSKSTADFLKAIIMGDKTGLDEDIRLTFANGGLAHILALSGLHIGILAGFLIMLMMPLKFLGHYKWGYLISIVILWLFVAVTGFAYSSVRACIMTTFAFIGIATERKNFAGNALCSACLLILIVDPMALFDVGFQLSVVCVGALIAFASSMNPISHRHHPVLFYICGAILATIVATAASWVLISYYFSQIPLMFLPTNLLLLPILPVYLSVGILYTTLLCVGLEIRLLGHLLDQGYNFLLKSSEMLSGGADFVINYQLPLWGVLLWLILLAICAIIYNRKNFT
ncbi:MAG: ComEC/Rec2 family competence protein [Muribaculaceae bacterium]|nr:ComEC/Rec2 family competence protein [Muribaculaceae bacterium]